MKSAIFDLDGVIVDTAKFHYLAWRKVAERFDYKLTENQNEKLKGISRTDSLILILKWARNNVSNDEFNKLLVVKNNFYLDLIKNLKPDDSLPGVNETFKYLKNNGIKIALGSASKNSKIVLTKLSLTNYFDTIIDGNDLIQSKPHPEVFIKGAEALGVSCSNCIVFEDSIAGVEAAKSAKMNAIGICDSKQKLKKTLFNIDGFLAIKPEDLIKYFKK